jgi:anti-anti-sigma factor
MPTGGQWGASAVRVKGFQGGTTLSVPTSSPAFSTACALLPDLKARRYGHDGCTVLALSGEIDASCAPSFRAHLQEALDQGSGRLVVDLRDVPFMDLAGVGELVHAFRRMGWAIGSIRLLGPSPFVRRVLDLTQVGAICPIYDTLADALAVPKS